MKRKLHSIEYHEPDKRPLVQTVYEIVVDSDGTIIQVPKRAIMDNPLQGVDANDFRLQTQLELAPETLKEVNFSVNDSLHIMDNMYLFEEKLKSLNDE